MTYLFLADTCAKYHENPAKDLEVMISCFRNRIFYLTLACDLGLVNKPGSYMQHIILLW